MYCRGQAGYLTDLQDQMALEHPELSARIVFVNRMHREDGLSDLTAISDLPVVQDGDPELVWDRWGAHWRDVFVLDADNHVVDVYNLTRYDLQDDENYQGLYDIFLGAAETP